VIDEAPETSWARFNLCRIPEMICDAFRFASSNKIEWLMPHKTSEGETMMKNRTKAALFSLACAVVVFGVAVAGAMSLSAKTTTSSALAPEPVQASCSAVTVTNIQTQSVALGQAEKVTVDWSFTPPAGGDGCAKVQNFEVWIEVTRRSNRKNTRKLDASATAHSLSAEFSEAGIGNLQDSIKSVKAVVTANLVAVKAEKVLTGL
jgi:hypothetical protein